MYSTDCSVCTENYVTGLGYTCEKCTISRTGSIALAVILSVLCIVAGASIIMFLVERKTEGTRRGVVVLVTRYIPTHSVKIIIVVWQILTQVGGEHEISVILLSRMEPYSLSLTADTITLTSYKTMYGDTHKCDGRSMSIRLGLIAGGFTFCI